MTKSRGISVIEVIFAVVVLTIVISLAIAGYDRYQDRTAMLVDDTNQKVLQAAVKLYAYDTNALPGSLSELRPMDLQRAVASVTQGKRPFTLLAYLQEQLGMLDIAEAVPPLPGKYYNNDINILTCPMDPTPPSEGGVSYILAAGWEGRPLSVLLDPRNGDETLIVEADDNVGKQVVFRHGEGTLTVETSVKGDRRKKPGRAASRDEWVRKPKHRSFIFHR